MYGEVRLFYACCGTRFLLSGSAVLAAAGIAMSVQVSELRSCPSPSSVSALISLRGSELRYLLLNRRRNSMVMLGLPIFPTKCSESRCSEDSSSPSWSLVSLRGGAPVSASAAYNFLTSGFLFALAHDGHVLS